MQARRFVDLGRRLLASSRPALSPLPPECLRSVAFPVNPSILKPVCADMLPPGLRSRPPGLEFYPSSHRLSSKKAKRRLRRPEIVHAGYAKVMKKLNFCV
ncbi:unnamed protein product [Musa textilis]